MKVRKGEEEKPDEVLGASLIIISRRSKKKKRGEGCYTIRVFSRKSEKFTTRFPPTTDDNDAGVRLCRRTTRVSRGI